MPFVKGYKQSEEHKRKIGEANSKPRIARNCVRCDKAFTVPPYKIAEGKGKFCSRNCKCIASRGKLVTADTRLKLSLAGKGRKLTQEHKDAIRRRQIGRSHGPHTMETRLKMRESKLGPKSYNWQGDKAKENFRIRESLQYREWRKAVFERDNYTCQFCNIRGQKGLGKTVRLNADHIKPFAFFPELRLDINNGRTLCVPCHRTTDTWGTRVMRKEAEYKKALGVT